MGNGESKQRAGNEVHIRAIRAYSVGLSGCSGLPLNGVMESPEREMTSYDSQYRRVILTFIDKRQKGVGGRE